MTAETVPLQEAVIEGTLFFLPLPQLLELLNLPVQNPDKLPEALGDRGYWSCHAQWQQLLDGGLFSHSAARAYWRQRLEEERALACQILTQQESGLGRLRCLAHSALAGELGCPPAGERLRCQLQDTEETDALLESGLLLETRLADVFALALRLAAWRVVDLSLQHWELLAEGGEQDEVLLERFLPAFDNVSGHWNNPVEDYLAHLATLAGCAEQEGECSGLARLWAGEDMDVRTREYLLGAWCQGRRRADARAVTGLMDAVLRRLLGVGEAPGDLALNRQLLCESFRFVESCAYLQRTLGRLGMADAAVGEIFAVYHNEYRRARAALGRPLAEDGGR
ncbi:hypothetical protein [Azotobacter salinestris]|uniref:hypothetical protein n=1 Tax=Azotobacter salinestris TaxID=69964 RepID=UPI0032DF2450